MISNPDLKTCKWAATFHKTIARPDGKIDMWLIHDDETGEGVVSIGVPHGRKDIVELVVRSCAAGQRVLQDPRFSGSIEKNYRP